MTHVLQLAVRVLTNWLQFTSLNDWECDDFKYNKLLHMNISIFFDNTIKKICKIALYNNTSIECFCRYTLASYYFRI